MGKQCWLLRDKMTSSSRHLRQGQPFWDQNIQQYKNYDPFVERDLISILFLSHNKPALTKICLLQLIESTKSYSGELEWIFINNDCNPENYNLFSSLDLERKVILQQKNYGINHGFNQAWRLSRGEYCLIMESDWYNQNLSFNFLQVSKDILKENLNTKIVQLRAIWDRNENWGQNKPEFWPWNIRERAIDAGYPVYEKTTLAGHNYLECTFPNGFCNNPILMSKSLYREIGTYPEPEVGTDPRHGETLYQEKVWKSKYSTAHINKELFFHAGGTMRNYYESLKRD